MVGRSASRPGSRGNCGRGRAGDDEAGTGLVNWATNDCWCAGLTARRSRATLESPSIRKCRALRSSSPQRADQQPVSDGAASSSGRGRTTYSPARFVTTCRSPSSGMNPRQEGGRHSAPTPVGVVQRAGRTRSFAPRERRGAQGARIARRRRARTSSAPGSAHARDRSPADDADPERVGIRIARLPVGIEQRRGRERLGQQQVPDAERLFRHHLPAAPGRAPRRRSRAAGVRRHFREERHVPRSRDSRAISSTRTLPIGLAAGDARDTRSLHR